jgi:sucrose phosphorylase
MTIKNQVQLITYADSLGGDLKALNQLFSKYFAGLFKGGLHILPPFPSSADRGFAPLTYFEIEPAFGTWQDIRNIGEQTEVMVDLMVNHISRQSHYFQDFVKQGRKSKYADLFITLDKIWPGGNPSSEDVAKIFLRKPENPFSEIVVTETGKTEKVWTSFGTKDWSEQVDLDINSPTTQKFFKDVLAHMSQNGVKMVRLDAIGYIIKKPGTSCFFVEPEIYDFMTWIKTEADALGVGLLPEVHAHYSIQFKLAQHGYWVYDFILPMLILHTLINRSSTKLRDYLKICPHNQITMLDCHDGIPVQPDLDDILEIDEAQHIVQICLERGANLNRILSPEHKSRTDFDTHQINCTYYSALDENDDAYIAARAIQFFSPGVPQVYYVGLLAGSNDLAEVKRVGEGRAINRHNYTVEEVNQELQRPVVKRLMELIQFRNEYDAFNGIFQVCESKDGLLQLSWQKGTKQCILTVDLNKNRATIQYQGDNGDLVEYIP